MDSSIVRSSSKMVQKTNRGPEAKKVEFVNNETTAKKQFRKFSDLSVAQGNKVKKSNQTEAIPKRQFQKFTDPSPTTAEKRKAEDSTTIERESNKQFQKFKCGEVDPSLPKTNVSTRGRTSNVPSIKPKKCKKLSVCKPLRKIPHYFLPEVNVHHVLEPQQVDDLKMKGSKEMFTSFPWPLYISSGNPEEIDSCHKRVKACDEYFVKLKKIHGLFNAHKNKKHNKKAMKNGIYPQSSLIFTELLEQNPDPYFNSRYDWYYTGGNLCVIDEMDSNDEIYLFHVAGDNLDNLVISKIKNNKNHIQLDCLDSMNLKSEEPSEIFEVQPLNKNSSSSSSSLNLDCILRQKYSISHCRYSKIDEINNEGNNLSSLYEINNENVPFISFSQDLNIDSHLITTDLSKTVKLWDLNKSTENPLQILYNPSSSSSSNEFKQDQNWNCIRYFQPNTYAFTDLYKFTMLDTRIDFNDQKYEFSSLLKDSCYVCEKISFLSKSKLNENHLYLSTSHKIFSIDVRYFKRRNSIVTEFTHQMYSPPIMLDTSCNDGINEIILMASPYYEDIHLCQHQVNMKSCSSLNFTGSLPLQVENNCDIFQKLRKDQICLGTSKNIESRIQSCNTGVKFLNFNKNSFILKANSIGDIFIQQLRIQNDDDHNLSLEAEYIENSFIEQWKNYENQLILRNQLRPLNVTCVEDFSSFKKVFRCIRLDQPSQKITRKSFNQPDNAPTDVEDEIIQDLPKRLQRWQKPFEELKKYKDALAKDILSIWDCDSECDDNDGRKDENAIVSGKDMNLKRLSKVVENKTDASEKISDWISRTSNDIPLVEKIITEQNEGDKTITESPLLDYSMLLSSNFFNNTFSTTKTEKLEDDDVGMNLNDSKLIDTSIGLGPSIESFLHSSEFISSQNFQKKKVKKKYNMGF